MRWCPLFLASFSFFWQVAAVAVNRSIDDTFGDSVTGTKPVYLPSTPGVWEDATCAGCAIQPDPNLAFKGTWTAATYNPSLESISFQLTFTGTAIYVFFILANFAGDGITTETACNFTLDGFSAGSFDHIPSTSTLLEYNSLVFSQENLENTDHSLVVSTSGITDRNIFVNFDYAMYTFDNTTTPLPSTVSSSSSNTAISTTTSPLISSQTSSTASKSKTNAGNTTTPLPSTISSTSSNPALSTTSPLIPSPSIPSQTSSTASKSKTNAGVIAGTVIGGVAVLLTFLLLLFLFCRRRRARLSGYHDAGAIDGYGSSLTSQSMVGGPHPINMASTATLFQNRPVTESDFLQSGTIVSPYTVYADNERATQFFGIPATRNLSEPPQNGYRIDGSISKGSGQNAASATVGYSRGFNDSDRHAILSSVATNSIYGGIASDTSSSQGQEAISDPPHPFTEPNAVDSGPVVRDQKALRRQSEIDRQVQAVTQEIGNLKTDITRRTSSNHSQARQDATEMEEMREQMRQMREQLEHLKSQQQSAWAQGLSDEAPPGYSRVGSPE